MTSDPTPEGRVFLNRQKSYGIFVESFGPGNNQSSFWLGFSTEEVSQAAKKIVLSVTLFSALALAVLAGVLYLTIEYFTKPIKALAEGAATVGDGTLSYRVPVQSDDELGRLAHAFNQMAEHLETTTTSIDNLNREIAERQRIEDELRSSEERFKTLFEYAPDAHYLHDLQGRVIDVNKAAEQLTGYSRDELVGHVLLDLDIFPPSEKPEISSLVARNAAGYHDRTGRDHGDAQGWLAGRRRGDHAVAAHQGRAGRARRGPRYHRRKKAEDEIRASEERLKILFECAPDAIYLVDMNGCFVDGNRAAEALTGFRPSGAHRKERGGERPVRRVEQLSRSRGESAEGDPGQPTGPDEFDVRRKDGTTSRWRRGPSRSRSTARL